MSSKFIDDDDIALALNDSDSSELESLTSEDDGWTDCEDDEEEEIIEERSINNNAVELVSDDEEVQPQHNPSREVQHNNNNSLPTWQNNHLYPPNSKKLKNPSIVWKFDVDDVRPKSDPREELERYQRERDLKISDNPLVWWKNNKQIYPLMSSLAPKYLCIQATSTSAERAFSLMGNGKYCD